MATKSQEVVKRAGIMMRISLAEKIIDEDGRLKGIKSTGEHKVKFIEDKVIKGRDFQTGKERLEMKYIFEENGEKKFYTKPLKDENDEIYYFVQRMSQYQYNDELILEYIPKGSRGFISIRKTKNGERAKEEVKDMDDDGIPVINTEENTALDEDKIDIGDVPF